MAESTSPGYRINAPSVVSQTIDQETIIIHFDSGMYYSANETGAAIWERARESGIEGLHAKVFSPEDQMLHLCMHPSVGHGFVVDLRPFFDIAQAIEYYAGEMDWDAFISRAREWGYPRAVCFTLPGATGSSRAFCYRAFFRRWRLCGKCTRRRREVSGG